jgi:hypothetical protein
MYAERRLAQLKARVDARSLHQHPALSLGAWLWSVWLAFAPLLELWR